MEEKSAPEMHRSSSKARKAGESKADARYWIQGKRLVLHDSANYSIQIQAQGRRVWFPLGTPNKKGAAAKAAEIYSFIQAHGLEAALQRYKPKTEAKTSGPTVGDLIKTACGISSARRHTLDTYAKAFRVIVAETQGITFEQKHNAKGGGTAKWRAKVDAVPLEIITPAVVLAWKNARLRAVESDPLAKRRATITVNSTLRNAKSLFGKKLLPFIEQELPLPVPLPFEGVNQEKSPSLRYVSKIDAFAILARAKDELAETDPEGFKVLILALVCGLRRSEIDNLLWRAFDFPNCRLRVESSEYHELKSEDSAGEIDLDADTVALFRGYRAQHPKSLFVIESPHKPRNQMKARCYRCDAIFKRMLAWLRAQGVEGSKPLHTMRKEIGSIIASEHGIFEASRYLRHSDIRITSAFYADKKKTVTPKTFSGLLGNGTKVEEGNFTGEAAPKKRIESK
ncbi:MAG: site-specific integrase [Luteolibacter sp.]